MCDTWPRLLKHNSDTRGSELAMRQKYRGIWHAITWQHYYLSVKYLALGLLALDFRPGDRLLVIGDNAPEWNYAQLAAQANHGVSIGMYPDLSPAEITYIAQQTGARFAVVENQEQADKFLQVKKDLPHLEKAIYWRYKGLSGSNDPLLYGMRQVQQLGKEYESTHPTVFEENITSATSSDVCSIIFTSGTTGNPKGAVHTYASMKTSADYITSLAQLISSDNIACYLPPAWVTEQLVSVGCHLLSGSILNYGEDAETLLADIREIGPDIVFGNARQWESQASKVQARVQGADALKRFSYRRMIATGYRMAATRARGLNPGFGLKLQHAIARLLLFRPIRDSLGLPNTRACYTSSLVLSPETLLFYMALGVPLRHIYGTTEGGILSGTKPGETRTDTVGSVAPGSEVGITEEGEIVYRQPGMFSGYVNDPDATQAVVKDNWFYSGDAGSITEDSQLVFTDRKNDLIELDNGEIISPQLLESRLRYSPYIRDAWILGDPERKTLGAIIIIDYSTVGSWAGKNKVAYTTFSDLSQKQQVYELIRKEIALANQTMPAECTITRYVLLHKEFDPDEGELTHDRKLRRAFLMERYRNLASVLFSDASEVEVDAQIKYRDGRTGTVKTVVAIKDVRETMP